MAIKCYRVISSLVLFYYGFSFLKRLICYVDAKFILCMHFMMFHDMVNLDLLVQFTSIGWLSMVLERLILNMMIDL